MPRRPRKTRKRCGPGEGPTALFDLSKHAEPTDDGDQVSIAAG
jgi:hypothetical protein